MKRKVKKGFRLLLFACLFAGAGYVGTTLYYKQQYVLIERLKAEDAQNEELKKEAQYMTINKRDYGQFVRLFEIYQELEEDHLYEVDAKKLINGAIAGMTNATGDPYTTYTAADSNEQTTKKALQSTYKGIGAEVSLMNGHVVIVNPYKDAPAHDAGVMPYDRILKVDGEDIKGWELADVTSKVKGEEGTQVVLTLQRGEGDPFDVTITRSEIHIENVTHEMIEENGKKYGRIDIRSFYEQTGDDFKLALEALEKEGIEGLIIDVRDNSGGFLGATQDVSGELLPIGTVVLKTESKEGVQKEIHTSHLRKSKKPYPIVVLVNEASASASEVLAAVLQENGGYSLIGTKTYGKGTIQELRMLDDQSELKITVAKWLTPSGEWIHEKGLTPDIEVEPLAIWHVPLVQVEKETTYQLGDVATAIQTTQYILQTLGYAIPKTNGYFDAQTTDALIQYQTEKGLTNSGKLDEDTAFSLNQTLLELKEDVTYDAPLKKAIETLSSK